MSSAKNTQPGTPTVFPDKKDKPKVSHSKKRIIFWAIVLSLIAFGAYLILRPEPPKPLDKNCQNYIDKIGDSMDRKDYNTVINATNLYLDKNCTNKQKVAMIELKGLAQLELNKIDDAEKTFKQVAILNNGKFDTASAQSLAGIYYKKGNKPEAVKYYKLLIQAVKDTPGNFDDAYIPQYKSIIKSLGGTP